MQKKDWALPGSPEFEDRKLQYLNAQARGLNDKQLKELEARYPDIVDALTEKPLPKKRISPPADDAGFANAEEAVMAFGALAICLAALPHLNDSEFAELGEAAASLHAERNPEERKNTIDKLTADMSDQIGVALAIGDVDDGLNFIAEESGAYEQRDGSGLVKFAAGDKLVMHDGGVMLVVSPIPENWATLKVPALASIAIGLGMPDKLKSKAEVSAWVEKFVADRQAEIDGIPDVASAEE